MNWSNDWAEIDTSSRQSLTATSSADGVSIVRVAADPATGALLITGTTGGTGTYYTVSGTIDGSNTTFTIPVAVGSDFVLSLARQLQIQDIGATQWDYSYSVGASTTTITYHTAPDESLSGQPHVAYVVS